MEKPKLMTIYRKLLKYYGHQGWWPIVNNKTLISEHHPKNYSYPRTQEERFEVCIGAILTQNTAWKNVEICINNLIKNKLIDIKKIDKIDNNELSKLIKSSGYYNQKTIKIKNFTDYVIKNYNGKLKKLSDKNINEIRKELLTINGIGKETADSIILYAFNKPIFVIDAYTKRIFERLFDLKFKDYDEWQDYFHKNLEEDYRLFNEYHALIVEHGKNICKKKPLCNDCVLNEICNHKLSQ